MQPIAITRRSQTLTLSNGQAVTVRELAWPDMLQFTGLLTRELEPVPDLIRGLKSNAEVIEKIIPIADRIGPWLVERSTGLSPVDMGATDFLRLLTAAVELSINDDLITVGKAMAARFRPMLTSSLTSPPPTS